MHWGNQKFNLTRFIAILTLLQWSGSDPSISPRYVYNVRQWQKDLKKKWVERIEMTE